MPMDEALGPEIMEALRQGNAIKKRDELTRWRRPTRLLLISAGKRNLFHGN